MHEKENPTASEDIAFKVIAEQTVTLSDEISMFKKETRQAFVELTKLFRRSIRDLKTDNDVKCSTLNKSVIKLVNKVESIDTKLDVSKKKHSKNKLRTHDERIKIQQTTSSPKTASSITPEFTPVESVTSLSSNNDHPSQPVKDQKQATTSFLSKPKVLFVSDTVTSLTNLRLTEEGSNTRIRTARSLDSKVLDVNSVSSTSFNILNHNLSFPGKEEYEYLVLSASSKLISQADSSGISAESKVSSSMGSIVKTAETSLKQHKNLKKVIIMEHIPRFDSERRSYLAKLANKSLLSHVKNSPLSRQIVIGRHRLNSYGIGKTHMMRYGDPMTGRFDGIHFFGPSGSSDLTNNMIAILRSALQGDDTAWSIPKKTSVNPLLNDSPVTPVKNRFEILSNQGN